MQYEYVCERCGCVLVSGDLARIEVDGMPRGCTCCFDDDENSLPYGEFADAPLDNLPYVWTSRDAASHPAAVAAGGCVRFERRVTHHDPLVHPYKGEHGTD